MEPVAYSEVGPKVHTFYERSTATWQYVVADPSTKIAVVIDPVLGAGGGISTTAADNILATIRQCGYTVSRILDTRAAGSGKSSAWYLRTQLHEKTGVAPRISLGKSVAGVQRLFARKYGIHDAGWDFDRDFQDGEAFPVGELQAQALFLPAQSADHIGYLIGGNVFIGDSTLIAVEDLGRSDSADESVHQRWASLQRLLGMPSTFRIYTSHGNNALGDGGMPFETVEDLRVKCKILVNDGSS